MRKTDWAILCGTGPKLENRRISLIRKREVNDLEGKPPAGVRKGRLGAAEARSASPCVRRVPEHPGASRRLGTRTICLARGSVQRAPTAKKTHSAAPSFSRGPPAPAPPHCPPRAFRSCISLTLSNPRALASDLATLPEPQLRQRAKASSSVNPKTF